MPFHNSSFAVLRAIILRARLYHGIQYLLCLFCPSVRIYKQEATTATATTEEQQELQKQQQTATAAATLVAGMAGCGQCMHPSASNSKTTTTSLLGRNNITNGGTVKRVVKSHKTHTKTATKATLTKA